MPAGDCNVFCPWDISSSLCTVCHSPSLQPDAEKISKLFPLPSSPLLCFLGVKCRTKTIKESISLWCKTKAGQYLSFCSNGKKAAYCSALETLAHAISPSSCQWNNWLEWGKVFLQGSVGLSHITFCPFSKHAIIGPLLFFFYLYFSFFGCSGNLVLAMHLCIRVHEFVIHQHAAWSQKIN